MGWLLRRLFGISCKEATFARRGFLGSADGQQGHLEHIGMLFLYGYHSALEEDRAEALALRLNEVKLEFRGFAFEGAAMGLSLLDRLTPWKRDRWLSFVRGPGSSHVYMVHVGVGWTLARLRRDVDRALQRLDSVLGWLAVDGYGFHEGYFHWRRAVERQEVPKRLSGYALRVFDQGLGRSLWFVNGADVARTTAAIKAFPTARQADLWSGVGLACTYAGGADREAIESLRRIAGPHVAQLAQGAAFAAKARDMAGNPTGHTELACQRICGMSAEAAANVTDLALQDLGPSGTDPAYEVWRQRIQAQFAEITKVP